VCSRGGSNKQPRQRYSSRVEGSPSGYESDDQVEDSEYDEKIDVEREDQPERSQ
jgi:hypothetical protein